MMVTRSLATFLLAAAWLLLPSFAHAGTLRILTYNIHHGAGTDGVLDLNRIASVISAANPDIVTLQEVDNGVPRTNDVDQVARLAQLTGMQSYFAKTRNLDGGTYGNAVLLRQGIGIVSSQNFALPNPDNTEPRVVSQLGLSFDLNPATAEFNLFATHLAHDSPAGRQQSATFINNLVSSSTVPSILAGDMNANPGSTAFNILDNQWIDATNIANSGKNRDNQIDYVFYRSTSQWTVTTAGQFILNATTNVASDHDPLLAVLDLKNVWPGSALVWNNNTGVATAVSDGFATGNGSASVGDFPASPWSDVYNNGTQNLLMGYNGNATVSGSSTRTIGSLRIGTNQANSIIAGRNGNGTLTASGTMGMVISSTTEGSGDLYVGEGGQTGTLNWNGSGTLEVQGRLRVGQGGTGTFNQANGVVIAGNTAGSFRFIAIGTDPGSTGTYNLDGGVLRPSGGFAGTEFRQTLVGDNGATGTLNVGNDIGTTGSAAIETNDDLIIGRGGGTGTLRVRSDGRIELRTSSNQAEMLIGESGSGTVVQTGGTVTSDGLVRIGGGATGVATYTISSGTLAAGTDGVAPFQIARSGATGTLRVSGTAIVTHGAEMIIADDTNTGSNGRLELIGSQASFRIGQLDNVSGGVNGMRETIRWQADAGGVTPIAVTGTGALTSNRVRLQSASELAANTGTGASLSGDGVALELDLSTITTSRILTLINNQSSDFIQGFFEKGTSTSLYAEGAAILDTGFNGTVNISYIGGTGNDVVLNLIAATIPGDHNADGGVDARDYVVWRKTASANIQGYLDWRANFGASSGTGQTIAAAIPEPATAWFAFIAASLMLGAPAASRSRRVIAKNARGVLMTAMTLPPPVSNEPNAKPALRRSLWKIARPLLLAYLVIVLGMMFFETSLVYPIPDPSSGDWQPKSFQFEDVHFNSADGTKLHGWFVPHPSPARAILYCHGNGEDVSSHGELAAMLSKIYRASVFVFDYRGYGHSEGRPSEAGCIADGSAAQHWLAERMGIRPNDVVLMGRSLGSAVAIALAADNGARALVIENAFPTMTDVAASHYPWLPVRWIMTNRYDNLTRIQRYAGPLLQSHGANDELIPLPFARRLFDIAPSVNKRWMEFPGLGHNSAMPGQYYDQLAKFLDASATDASLSKPR